MAGTRQRVLGNATAARSLFGRRLHRRLLSRRLRTLGRLVRVEGSARGLRDTALRHRAVDRAAEALLGSEALLRSTEPGSLSTRVLHRGLLLRGAGRSTEPGRGLTETGRRLGIGLLRLLLLIVLQPLLQYFQYLLALAGLRRSIVEHLRQFLEYRVPSPWYRRESAQAGW